MPIRHLLAALALLLGLALGASAQVTMMTAPQEETQLDYDAWGRLATRAEGVLDSGSASQNALEALRSELAAWRQRLLDAQGVNKDRIDTLQEQLDALGPVPESGDEDPEVATRRSDLNDRLSELRAPVLRAEEAYTRADGLISEIDGTIRQRQADALLKVGPSPLDPENWPSALTALPGSMSAIVREVQGNWASEAKRAELQVKLPRVGLFLVLAFGLIFVGQHWVDRVIEHLRHRTGKRGTGVWRFFASLAWVLLPYFGLVLLTRAAGESDLFGVRGVLLLDNLPAYGLALLIVRWLASLVFSADDDRMLLDLSSGQRTEARAWANALSILIVLRAAIGDIAVLDNYAMGTRVVYDFPILVICALILFRLGRILTKVEASLDTGEPVQNRTRIARLLGRVIMVIAVAGPVLAAVGYTNIGEFLVYPSIRTLALLGMVLVLLKLVNDAYALAKGRTVEDDDSLIPVLAGFLLSIAALPFLALIWGARVADLTEFWNHLREGFQVGDTRISPSVFFVFVIVFVIGYLLTNLTKSALRNSVLPKTKLDLGGQNAVVAGVGYLGIFLAAVVAITTAGIDLSALAIVAGALSVGIGFGLQNIVSNFVSGIILLIERPISEGDMIEVSGQLGTVKDISVRSTRIETFDRTDVIVPNADLVSGTVVNYTRGNSMTRIFFTFGVAYGSDTQKVQDMLLSIIRAHPKVMAEPAPTVIFANFGADALEFEVRIILYDIADKLATLSEINHEIARRCTEEGIEIPFAQRDVWLRNPEALTGAAKPKRESEPESEPASQGDPAGDSPPVKDAMGAAARDADADVEASDGDGR